MPRIDPKSHFHPTRRASISVSVDDLLPIPGTRTLDPAERTLATYQGYWTLYYGERESAKWVVRGRKTAARRVRFSREADILSTQRVAHHRRRLNDHEYHG